MLREHAGAPDVKYLPDAVPTTGPAWNGVLPPSLPPRMPLNVDLPHIEKHKKQFS